MRLDPLFEAQHVAYFLLFLFLAWGALLAWQWMNTKALAKDVYEAKREQGELADHVDEDTFVDVFTAAEAPRRGLYFFLSALVCGLAIPPAMALFSNLWYEVWSLTGRFEPVANGTLVYTFATFVFCMGVMVAVLYLAMKRFYALQPPNLKDAISNLNGTPLR
ncbi:MAG: hypothetical protein AAF216_02220 [Pseudomonadota bacterium]